MRCTTKITCEQLKSWCCGWGSPPLEAPGGNCQPALQTDTALQYTESCLKMDVWQQQSATSRSRASTGTGWSLAMKTKIGDFNGTANDLRNLILNLLQVTHSVSVRHYICCNCNWYKLDWLIFMKYTKQKRSCIVFTWEYASGHWLYVNLK